jgi:hypothetical protein
MNFYSRHRFTILLAALLLLMASRPATSGSRLGELVVSCFGLLLLVAAIVTLCAERRFRGAALAIGIPPIVIVAVSEFLPQAMADSTRLAARGCAAAFLAFTVVMIVRSVLTTRDVTWDTIIGALTGYVLMGIVWTQMYSALELAAPRSFAVLHSSLDMRNDPMNSHAVLEYFSFATLSTVGYGDVTPVSRSARSLAALEAVCGQVYLAVLVAGLVGIRGGVRASKTPDAPSEPIART